LPVKVTSPTPAMGTCSVYFVTVQVPTTHRSTTYRIAPPVALSRRSSTTMIAATSTTRVSVEITSGMIQTLRRRGGGASGGSPP
jgi:hypothetical protein